MKLSAQIPVFAFIGSLLSAVPAFAIHAYDEQSCVAKVGSDEVFFHSPRYWSGCLTASRYSAAGVESVDVAGVYNTGDQDPGCESDLRVVEKRVLKDETKDYNDGCWIGIFGKVTKTLVVESITPEAAAALGLSKGQKLKAACDVFRAEPVGNCKF